MKKSVFLLLIVFLFLPFFASLAFSDNYYISNHGNDANDGLSPGTAWKTIGKINNFSFDRGDVIKFEKTGIWREQLNVPRSYLTFESYGTGSDPIISGANLLSDSWSHYSGYVYRRALSKECHIVFNGDTELQENDGYYSSLKINEWDWHNGYLYVNIGYDPSGGRIEASQRNNCIYIGSDCDYIIINGLSLKYTQGGNDNLNAGAINNFGSLNSIMNCNIQYIYGSGVSLKSAHNTLIQDTVIKHVNGRIIECYSKSNNVHIDRCHLEDSAHFGAIVDAEGFIGGGSGGNEATGLIIENSYFKDCISASISTNYHRGAIIRYNLVVNGGYSREGNSGIAFENAINPECYANVITDCYQGINISGSTGAKVYNNTVYNCESFGLKSSANGSNWTVKNNIFYNNGNGDAGAHNYYETWVTSHTGGTHTNNLYWDDSYSNLVYDGKAYTKYNIISYEGTCIHQDPDLTDKPNRVLTLSDSSPCIDAGSGVESGCADHLNPASVWPFSVSTLNQNDYGSAWEIGAFVYGEGEKDPPSPPTGLKVL